MKRPDLDGGCSPLVLETGGRDAFIRHTVLAGAILGAMLAVPSQVFAQEPYGPSSDIYIEPRAGTTFFDTDLPDDVLDTDTHAGVAVGGAIGMADPGTGLRGEAELLYQRAGFELGPEGDHLDALSMMVNGYFDVPAGGPVRPYVGAGVGTARVGAVIDGIADDSDWVLAYNLQAGLTYDLWHGGQMTAGYRYTGFEEAAITGLIGELETETHAVHVGYRLRF